MISGDPLLSVYSSLIRKWSFYFYLMIGLELWLLEITDLWTKHRTRIKIILSLRSASVFLALWQSALDGFARARPHKNTQKYALSEFSFEPK
jgi:hypothetical protein